MLTIHGQQPRPLWLMFHGGKEKGQKMMWLKTEIGIIVGGMLFSGFDYSLSSGEV